MNKFLRVGTCSWKYDSWRGLIYPEQGPINYLREYSCYYNTVEVDQWFWSLFKGDNVVLPKTEIVQEYFDSVPDDFSFCIKVPNSITLTHHYNKDKKAPLQANPYFLSAELMLRFLDSIEPLSGHMGPLIFQFEYLNKKKMSSPAEFFEKLGVFAERLPGDYKYCVETRNPNYLGSEYFYFLSSNDLHHVFLHGYYMPSIFDLYETHKEQLKNLTVIRLHGQDRQGIEKQTRKKWNEIVAPRNKDLENLGKLIGDLSKRNIETFLYVNNHFEGSAPRTISRINELLEDKAGLKHQPFIRNSFDLT